MIYRTATLEDVDRVIAVFDTVRITIPVYYPSLPRTSVSNIIITSLTDPLSAFCLVAEREGKIMGYVAAIAHELYGIRTVEEFGIFVAVQDITVIESVSVLRNLMKRTHAWAKSVDCNRVFWSVTVGKWDSFQAIAKSIGCKQIGICMEYTCDG